MLKTYYYLTKPGIIYGNALTALGGFLLASDGSVRFGLLLATIVGISLIIASACVFNNYIDKDIDKKMARTKKRALVRGVVAERNAVLYAGVLGALGFLVLSAYTNLLTVIIGMVGFVDYVVLYGLSKRQGPYGTIVGSISGATPILAGYCAVTNRIDMGGVLLFLILVCWQMPHFYAIAMYRHNDYAAADIPVLPVKKGAAATKVRIVFYIAAFLLMTMLLSVFGYTGFIFFMIMSLLSLYWLWRGLQGFKATNDSKWARKMFFWSLIVILMLSIMLSLNPWLP